MFIIKILLSKIIFFCYDKVGCIRILSVLAYFYQNNILFSTQTVLGVRGLLTLGFGSWVFWLLPVRGVCVNFYYGRVRNATQKSPLPPLYHWVYRPRGDARG